MTLYLRKSNTYTPSIQETAEILAIDEYMKAEHQGADGPVPSPAASYQLRPPIRRLSRTFLLNDKFDGLEGDETRLWSADDSKHVDAPP